MYLNDHPVEPDFDSLIDVLHRRKKPDRVYQAELFMDHVVRDRLKERLGVEITSPDRYESWNRRSGESPLPSTPTNADLIADLRSDIDLYRVLGYELVRVHLPAGEFRMDVHSSADVVEEAFKQTSQGYTVHEHDGPIQNERDLDAYPWPDIASLDRSLLEWADTEMPAGMKGYDLTMQVFEATSWLMGYETLFMSMYDRPEFVERVIDRVGKTYLDYTTLLCEHDSIGVVWGTDDMGFKSGTMVAPHWLKEKILPWHREAARVAHQAGKQYFLHSCGDVEPVMDAFIGEVGIDAKHSFEDDVIPVTEFFRRHGDEVGVIGGLDIDFLCRADEAAIRGRVREVLESCHPEGGYALGSGNSITDYMPLDNYLAMLDEGRRFGAG